MSQSPAATGPRRNRGMAAAQAKASDGRGQHLDWLNLAEISGPFLTLPVLLETWPQLDTLGKEQRPRLRRQHAMWQADQVAGHAEWIEYILGDLLEWGDRLALRDSLAADGDDAPSVNALLDRFTLPVPEHDTELRADFALVAPGIEFSELAEEPDAVAAAKHLPVLGMVLPPGTPPTARLKTDAWAATPADRLVKLLRHHHVDLGIITDGRWWCLVWSPVGGVTTTVVLDSIDWNQVADRNVVRAWLSMLCRDRFFSVPDEETLIPLLKRSLDNQEEVTDALGVQVRQAVELLVDAIHRADRRGMEQGRPGLHAQGVTAAEVYRGAVAVMMRIIFLLVAEERGLLPADNEVYAKSYSAGRLCAELEAHADAEGESSLDYTTAAWHRLIALFHAVYGGVNHPDLRLPAYGGSIFDPQRYWWLEGKAEPGTEEAGRIPLLAIDDRTVLHMLSSVQYVTIGGDRKAKSARQLVAEQKKKSKKTGERRKLTFRALDVEQIGYVYEGLLSYDAQRAEDTMVGLIGPLGKENEVELAELEHLAAPFGVGALATPGATVNLKGLAKKITETFKEPKPGIGSTGAIEKAISPLPDDEVIDAERRLYASCHDRDLTERLKPFYGLIRADLRGYPTVMAGGALYVAESSLRKNTGTHYTPRFLAEQVVEGALEPLVYEPGPLQTANRDDWVPKPAEQILNLKVADIAMGSAAFLVAACRYLADRLIEAWAREGTGEAAAYHSTRVVVDEATAIDAEADPVLIRARRQVIEHCLYGVDINPLAVEMAKLSLWLVSMDPERPFTFLDDRLAAGDSLLGIVSLEQLEAIHLDPKAGRRLNQDLYGWTAGVHARVAEVAEERRAISGIKSDDLARLDEKQQRLGQAHEHMARLSLIGDLIAGASLASAGTSDAIENRTHAEVASLSDMISGENIKETDPRVQSARKKADALLATDLPSGGFSRRPLHWPLEFPEVFELGGFDAIVGNPPFLGSQKLTGSLGEAYREYLVKELGRKRRGQADLVAYFELQAHRLLNRRGQTGMIATNTLAQGDTREVGLDQILADGIEIRHAVKSSPWPSKSAVLEYCAVWTSVPSVQAGAERYVDGALAPTGISASLTPKSRVTDWVEPLNSNHGISFVGSYVLGLGFTLPEATAQRWIHEDVRYSEVLFPYLNGQDINNSTTHTSNRWVINFHDWTEERASTYPLAYEQLLREVKPERMANNRKFYRDYWWQYAEKRPAMLRALEGLDRYIAITRVSKVVTPVMLPAGCVMSEATVIFASDDYALLAILSSAYHYWWAIDRASTMKGDLRYTPTDVFETLVRPASSDSLRSIGARLDKFRSSLMAQRGIGLTAVHNLIHDPACQDNDIIELRSIHRQIDSIVTAAYGWDDLLTNASDLQHDFHDTTQGIRYTVGTPARAEILDRLRELNHQQYADEIHLGLHKKPTEYADLPLPTPEARLTIAKRPPTSNLTARSELARPDNSLF
ncbi:Eco57I restriction-modification methylase domain-containing protein [Embleya sp. NPDC050493]|uniref:Eco57I restriction-modification methylase domain-containing protein n=1 Tax=Embleya sp. NPDC050493 TaxID=3363989 RepID=UPI0037BD25C7